MQLLTPANHQLLPDDLDRQAYNRNEEFAAQFCGQSVETLRGYRKRGVGPRYKKILGKSIRYSIASLTEFMESQPTGGGRAA
jgi:hypothetical protein